MSRRTQAIYTLLENLESLQKRLESCYDAAISARELEDISHSMGQDLKSLRFWIDSLYTYTGKSTSVAKKLSSRENGKKGGRPPKRVTQLRRRLSLIKEEIPALEHDLKFEDDTARIEQTEQKIELLKSECEAIEKELAVLGYEAMAHNSH